MKQLMKRSFRTVTVGGYPLARLDERRGCLTVSDADGRQVADITRNPNWWYVVNCKAPVDEPFRSLVLAASIVWDDTRTESC